VGALDRIEVYQSKRIFIFLDKDTKRQKSADKNLEKQQNEMTRSFLSLRCPLKYTFYLPFHYEYVLASFLSPETSKKLKGAMNFEKVNASPIDQENGLKHSFVTVRQLFKMPTSLFSTREINYLVSAKRMVVDGHETCMLIVRPFDDSNIEKLNENNQRGKLMETVRIIKVSDTLTRVSMVTFLDFGGYLRPLQKQLFSQQVSLICQYRDGMKASLTQMEKDGMYKPDTCGLMEAYEDNNVAQGLHPSIFHSGGHRTSEDETFTIDSLTAEDELSLISPDEDI